MKLLILVMLLISIALSGCLEPSPPKEYKVIQITKSIDEHGDNIYNVYYINSYNITTKKQFIEEENDKIIYSNQTKLIDESPDSLAYTLVLYLNKSDVITP